MALAGLDQLERILVYVQEYSHGHHLATALGCNFYRGSKDKTITNDERREIIRKWRMGDGDSCKVLVATEAFGPGNDYPHVRAVYVVGLPGGVVPFAQLAGRAGRDREPSRVWLVPLLSQRRSSESSKSPEGDHLGSRQMQMIANSNNRRCWRSLMSEVLDTVPTACPMDSKNLPCHCCVKLSLSPSQDSPSSASSLVKNTQANCTYTSISCNISASLSAESTQSSTSRRRAREPPTLDYHANEDGFHLSSSKRRRIISSPSVSRSGFFPSVHPLPGRVASHFAEDATQESSSLPLVNVRSHPAFDEPAAHVLSVQKASVDEEEAVARRVNGALQFVTGSCATCMVFTGTRIPHHSFYNCPTFIKTRSAILEKPPLQRKRFLRSGSATNVEEQKTLVLRHYAQWKTLLRYPLSGSCCRVCFRCHTPFLGDRVHKAMGGSTDNCDPLHNDMILPLAYTLFVLREDEIKNRFGRDWQYPQAYASWLVRTEVNEKLTNALLVFLWVVESLLSTVM